MKRSRIPLLVIAMTVLGIAPLTAQGTRSVVLQPGDAITLRLWPDDQGYSGEYFIGMSGLLALPFVGEIQAAGVPVEELEANIRRGYQARQQGIVSIVPRFFVSITGQVGRPSVYPVDPTQNLYEVVALAGGFTTAADVEKVRIVRDGQVIPINALSALERGLDLNRYTLRSGDQIIVPQRGGINVRTVFEIVRTVSTLVLLYDRLSDSN